MAKETKPVTFYLVRLDGELNIRETSIHYPFGDITLGRTKSEDSRDETYNVVFQKGSLTLNPLIERDKVCIDYLRVYNSGGEFVDHTGKTHYIQPNNQLFHITEEDPLKKVKEVHIVEEKIQEVEVLKASFAKLLEVDQIEQWAISVGISIPQENRTKEGLIKMLTEMGRIK